MWLLMLVGVSHLTVGNDLEGVCALINWLAYIPKVTMTAEHCIFSLHDLSSCTLSPTEEDSPSTYSTSTGSCGKTNYLQTR